MSVAPRNTHLKDTKQSGNRKMGLPDPLIEKSQGKKKPLAKADEEMTTKEIAQGFVDENGQEVYIIEDVLEFCPKRGYRVKWMGWSGLTWNKPKDMPRNDSWLNARMARARFMHFQEAP